MSLIRIKSRKNKTNDKKINKSKKMSKLEHDLTYILIDYLNIDIDSDYTLSYNYETIEVNNKTLAFPPHYISINDIDRYNQTLFRPFKSERHANILIEMFESSYTKSIDHLEVKYSEICGFNGYFVSKGKKIKNTEAFNMYTSQILKCACVARAIMNKNDYSDFINKLTFFMKNWKL